MRISAREAFDVAVVGGLTVVVKMATIRSTTPQKRAVEMISGRRPNLSGRIWPVRIDT
jgi:hypothetical protein